MEPLLAVDVSYYQGANGMSEARFRKLDRHGIQLLVNRASIGLARDPSINANHRSAEARGWDMGGYHFLRRREGDKQAEIFVDVMGNTPNGILGKMTALDVEWWTQRGHVVPDLCARPGDVEDFVARFRELLPKHKIGAYTADGYWRSVYMKNPDLAPLFDFLWQARWIDGDPLTNITLPANSPRAGFGGWETTPFWQWGMIHVSKRVGLDGDAFYGTLAELRALGADKAATPVPTPIDQRPRYRAGRDAFVTAARTAVAGLQPEAFPNPAFEAGFEAAKQDAPDALDALRLTA